MAKKPYIGIGRTKLAKGQAVVFYLLGDFMDGIDTNNHKGDVTIVDGSGKPWTAVEAHWEPRNNWLRVTGTPPADAKGVGGDLKDDTGDSQMTITNLDNQTLVHTFPATYT